MSYIAILGTHYELSIAELESLCGAESITPLKGGFCLLESTVDIKRLGGTIKISKVLDSFSDSSDSNVSSKAEQALLAYSESVEGKLQFGVSMYGKKIRPYDVQKLGLTIKKSLRAKDISVRLIPNKTQELNTAQVTHNKLTHPNGFELTIIYSQGTVYLCRTEQVQDIDSYTLRDRHKPVRDSFVGMLPPKLAQIMINLAHAEDSQTVLDPFCGTGTVLLEAALIGSTIVGSDLSEDMVDASRKNVSWFYNSVLQQPAPDVEKIITLGDAQTHTWENIDTVVCETYLGPPMRENPSKEELDTIMKDVLELHRNFLQNIASQIKSGTYLCLAVPMWRINNRTITLKLVDYLEELGYNRVSFKHVNTELQYYRPQAHVGRQLLTLIRN